MKRMVHWDDEENGESEIEPFEDASETDVSDDEQSNDEQPRIKDVLENLSQTVSRKRASDLVHSMAASKDILFWTSRGQLLRKNRIIPVTNIAELVEYVLLPHNDDVIKPRAINTFLDGLAELGVDKCLIKNKKILNNLLEKERTKGKVMRATVATEVTARKVNLKALVWKVIVCLTKKESFNKSPRNHALGTITVLIVPFVATTSRLTTNISKKPLPVVMTVVQQVTDKNMKTSKVSFYFPSEDQD